MKLLPLLLVLALAACARSGEARPAATPQRPVAVVDFAYQPSRITVPLGTTVTWTNYDAFGHTVSAGTQEQPGTAFDGRLGETTDGRGTTFSHTFSSAGTFSYYCDFHPDMQGTVTVVPIQASER